MLSPSHPSLRNIVPCGLEQQQLIICVPIPLFTSPFQSLDISIPRFHVPFPGFIFACCHTSLFACLCIAEAATQADMKRRKLCYTDPILNVQESTQAWNTLLTQDKPDTQDVHKALIQGTCVPPHRYIT